jgi:hypothetical protein
VCAIFPTSINAVNVVYYIAWIECTTIKARDSIGYICFMPVGSSSDIVDSVFVLTAVIHSRGVVDAAVALSCGIDS